MFPLTLSRGGGLSGFALGLGAALWLAAAAPRAETSARPGRRGAAFSAIAALPREAASAYRAIARHETRRALVGREPEVARPPRDSDTALAPTSRGRARSGSAAQAPLLPLPPALEGERPLAVPDRWRLVEKLGLVRESLLNPYQQNTLKGDRPIYGDAWFLNAGLESHSVYERGRVRATGALGRQEISAALGLTRGNTVFRPPDWQLRARATLSYAGGASLDARALRDPGRGAHARHLAVRELFVEKHLRTRTESYDFSSLRLGIQPFIADFRGFLYRDETTPALRLFGNALGNRFQYNLAYLRPLEKDAVSGFSELRLRRNAVLVANLYQQDYPVPGFQVQGTAVYDRDRERGARDVLYAGLSGDGHIRRLNLTFSAYAAAGHESERNVERAIRAYFAAAEASIDVDWYRLKAYALFASGDPDPSDGRAEGFDSLRERAQFAGLDAGFFQRESIALPGGVLLSSRDALLPSLRTAAREERTNFVNPGLRLLGVGADFDLLPELRLSLNATYLDFEETAPLAAFASAGRSARHIGEDYSLAIAYRPLFTQNIVVRLSLAALAPGRGLDALIGGRGDTLHSTRLELTLSY